MFFKGSDILKEFHIEREDLKIGSQAPSELFSYILALASRFPRNPPEKAQIKMLLLTRLDGLSGNE